LQYRNELVHRPRQINMLLPREVKSSLWVPPWVSKDQLRFDLYLRSHPWLPELQELAEADASAEYRFVVFGLVIANGHGSTSPPRNRLPPTPNPNQ
jgi:hypothetical protein